MNPLNAFLNLAKNYFLPFKVPSYEEKALLLDLPEIKKAIKNNQQIIFQRQQLRKGIDYATETKQYEIARLLEKKLEDTFKPKNIEATFL